MKMINSFFLVGPMGVGKTTIGRLLAEKLSFTFIDSDLWIERNEKQSIANIFAKFGEEKFREIESRAIHDLTRQNQIVLSTGGGAVLRDVNRAYLLSRGVVIFLDLAPEKIYERIKHDNARPLLQTDSPLITIQNIYDARKGIYLASSHYHLFTEDRTSEEISSLLFSLYNDPINFSSDWCLPLKEINYEDY